MSDFKIFAITRVTQSESLLLDIKSRDALRVDEKKGTMTLIRNESYVRHGDEARFEEVKIVGEAPKIFSLNVHVETKNISWDSKNRVRFVLKNKDVVIIQFVSRFVARNAAEALSRLVSSSSSELKFTYPDDTAQNQKSQKLPSLEVMVRVTKMHLYFSNIHPCWVVREIVLPYRIFARFKSMRIVVLRSTVESISTLSLTRTRQRVSVA